MKFYFSPICRRPGCRNPGGRGDADIHFGVEKYGIPALQAGISLRVSWARVSDRLSPEGP
jgi:hypothetical protein